MGLQKGVSDITFAEESNEESHEELERILYQSMEVVYGKKNRNYGRCIATTERAEKALFLG